MSYTHLSLAERHYIEVERKRGESLSKIGLSLGRSQSTISREIQRNTGKRGYRHKQATRTALDRHTQKNKAVKLTALIKAILNQYIKEDWSPEQIAGKLKTDGVISIHHETIYQYILEDKCNGGKLYTFYRSLRIFSRV